jgi:hypothetical protein
MNTQSRKENQPTTPSREERKTMNKEKAGEAFWNGLRKDI